jgi:hypothetical protein
MDEVTAIPVMAKLIMAGIKVNVIDYLYITTSNGPRDSGKKLIICIRTRDETRWCVSESRNDRAKN